MLKVAIVEDERAVTEQLREYVSRFCRQEGIEVSISLFSDGADIVDGYRAVWDIILMDIEMPLLDGMRAAAQIRESDPGVTIIFVTNMARLAVRGYEVDAMDFIVKPVSYAPFALKLKKAVGAVRRRERRYLLVSVGGMVQRVATDDIAYVEVTNHSLHIHLNSDGERHEHVMRGTLQEMERQLEGAHFERSSNSFLVNLRNVTGLRRDAVILGGEEVPLSRSRRKAFLQALSDYMGGGFR